MSKPPGIDDLKLRVSEITSGCILGEWSAAQTAGEIAEVMESMLEIVATQEQRLERLESHVLDLEAKP